MLTDFLRQYSVPTSQDYPFSYSLFSFSDKMFCEAYAIYLAAKIINRSTKRFRKPYLLNRYFYQLSGTDMEMEVVKWGDKLLFLSKLCIFNKNTNETKRFKLYELVQEMLFDSLYENGHFPDRTFEEEKVNLLNEIDLQKENQIDYHFQFFIEKMFSDEPFRFSLLGQEKNVKKSTNEQISALYKEYIHRSEKIPLLYGPFTDKEILFFKNFLHTKPNQENHQALTVIKQKPAMVEKKISYQQSWIFMGFRHDIHQDHRLFPALHLYNQILGKLPASLLYTHLREGKGLCYNIGSTLPFGKQVLFIIAGFMYKDKDKLLESINHLVRSIHTIQDTQAYLEVAKNRIISNAKSWIDYPFTRLNFELETKILPATYTFHSYLEGIQQIRWEDIEEAANHLWLDTVYICKGKSST